MRKETRSLRPFFSPRRGKEVRGGEKKKTKTTTAVGIFCNPLQGPGHREPASRSLSHPSSRPSLPSHRIEFVTDPRRKISTPLAVPPTRPGPCARPSSPRRPRCHQGRGKRSELVASSYSSSRVRDLRNSVLSLPLAPSSRESKARARARTPAEPNKQAGRQAGRQLSEQVRSNSIQKVTRNRRHKDKRKEESFFSFPR